MKMNKKKLILYVGITVVFLFIIFLCLEKKKLSDNLEVTFTDIGNADCILIKMPDNKIALIDGGEAENLKSIHDTLRKNKIKKIDYLINSHPHSDHIGTFEALIKIYDIGGFYLPDTKIESYYLNKVLMEAKKKNIPVNYIKRGDIICDSEIKIEVLAPYIPDITVASENNRSAVVLVTYKNNTFLFPGDIGSYMQKELILDYGNNKCDVLKASHHGSEDSNSIDIFEMLEPEYVIFSCSSDNSPTKIKNYLDHMSIKHLSTYENGNIILISNGTDITVRKDK